MNELIIVGASGHGEVVADIATRDGYEDIKFLDDDLAIQTCLDFPVVGTSAEANKFPNADFFVAIGNPEIRENIQTKLIAAGLQIVSLIHPNSVIARNVLIGEGTAVMAGAVINPGTVIGKGCIINTSASVDHDNQIKDYVHVSVGSHIAGTVTVGKSTWIGAGATVSNNIYICENCIIGAGAVVVRDIVEAGTYIGVPAKILKGKELRSCRKQNPSQNSLAGNP